MHVKHRPAPPVEQLLFTRMHDRREEEKLHEVQGYRHRSDSGGAVCVLVDTTLARVVVREYPITGDALGEFVRWIKEQADTVVALEGRNGQGKPFERALLCAGVPFYSFTAYEVKVSQRGAWPKQKQRARCRSSSTIRAGTGDSESTGALATRVVRR